MSIRRPHLSASAQVAVNNGAFTGIEITRTFTTETSAESFPTECELLLLEGIVSGIGATTQILVYLAWDSAGIRPFTDTLTIDLVPGTGATQGFGARLELPVKWPSDATPGSIWAHCDTDAGNVNVILRMHWAAPLGQ